VISELRVRNLATIEDVSLPLGPGLNVLTGETGAGKSMLVDALGLLLGGRADAGAIRPGGGKAVVEGVFEELAPDTRSAIESLGLDVEENRVVIRREVSSEGRSRAWINGSPTTAGVLADVGQLLVDLHGQDEARSLRRPETQRDLLDAFGEAGPERSGLGGAVAALRELREREQRLMARRDEALRRSDYLRHVVEEIDRARLLAGEDESLSQEARRLGGVEELSRAAHEFLEAIEGEPDGAGSRIAQADRALGRLERTDPATAEWRELLDQVYASLAELARLARAYADSLEDDPARLAQVESRRDLIHRLKQKHGATLEAVIEARRLAAGELELLDTADLDLRQLAVQRASGEAAVRAAAESLTAKRTAAAERLARGVNRWLPKLGLAGGRIAIGLDPLPEPTAMGAETVQLRAQLNPGMEERPLARVASGGELSRLMLAIRTVLARHDRMPTLVFDEVDQGIGGEIGSRVAEALAEVAGRHQVLVITHLPQIAAKADRHLVVAKRAKAGKATSEVSVIHGEDRVGELARMLGAPDAETARRHAVEMLKSRQ
jgi:DNA repair protein RecN (Recombination protein N)